jgi:hypothetical protein
VVPAQSRRVAIAAVALLALASAAWRFASGSPIRSVLAPPHLEGVRPGVLDDPWLGRTGQFETLARTTTSQGTASLSAMSALLDPHSDALRALVEFGVPARRCSSLPS